MANDLMAPPPAPSLSIPTFPGEIRGVEQILVDARTLHSGLSVGRDFSPWMQERIESLGLVEGEDFSTNRRKPAVGRPGTDYHLSLEAAKHLALAERNAAGRAVRQYFIDIERGTGGREEPAPELLHALRQQNALLKQQLAVHAQDYLARHPKAAQMLRYHAIAGLTQTERARLMGWKAPDTWRAAIKELAALGLVDYQVHEARSAAGSASMARLQARAPGAPSAATVAARVANITKARQALKARAAPAQARA